MLTLLLLATPLVFAAPGESPGRTVFWETFDNGVDSALRWKRRHWTLTGGALRTVDGVEGMATFTVGDLALLDWRLTFKVKRLVVPDGDQHFGVILRYADGTTLRVYCRGKAVYYWDQSEGRTRVHRRLGGELGKPLPAGDDAPWTTFAVVTRGAYVYVEAGSVSVGAFRREPAQLVSAQFYVYHLDCAFDDVRFEHLSAAPKQRPAAVVPVLVYSGDFDGVAALHGKGGDVPARVARGVTFTDGVSGQAVRVSRSRNVDPRLEYAAGNAFTGAGGTVMFWFRPDWDGRIVDSRHFPWYALFSTSDDSGACPFRIWQWHWLRADLSRGADAKGFSLSLRCRDAWLKGDWHHVALTWNENGWCTLYVDGVPYERGLTGNRYLPQRRSADLTAVRTFGLGCQVSKGGGMRPADGAFDELRLYRTPLSADQVTAEFRKVLPVDLLVERRFVRANRPGTLTMSLFPGGRMVVPAVGNEITKPVAVRLRARLVLDRDGRSVAKTTFAGPVEEDTRVPLSFPALPPGESRLTCTLTHAHASVQRSFRIVAYRSAAR